MVHKFRQSVGHAWRGILLVWKGERNFRIEVTCGALILIAAIILGFTYAENVVLILAIAAVLTGEIVNTIIEELLDVIAPEYSEHVRHLKDVTAGAVLLLSLFAAIAGILTVIHHVRG